MIIPSLQRYKRAITMEILALSFEDTYLRTNNCEQQRYVELRQWIPPDQLSPGFYFSVIRMTAKLCGQNLVNPTINSIAHVPCQHDFGTLPLSHTKIEITYFRPHNSKTSLVRHEYLLCTNTNCHMEHLLNNYLTKEQLHVHLWGIAQR